MDLTKIKGCDAWPPLFPVANLTLPEAYKSKLLRMETTIRNDRDSG